MHQPLVQARLTYRESIIPQHKNVDFDAKLLGLVRHMNVVEDYRSTLHELQIVWDNLTLLGQMSGTGADMGETRQAFGRLTGNLLNCLAEETLKKCVVEMSAKAQVSIDILVRNLFERTADIGFLATDDDVRRFIRTAAGLGDAAPAADDLERERQRLRERFAEYVAKYSVYSDIVLLDVAGKVLVRLDDGPGITHTAHPLQQKSLSCADAYVETFGACDLFPDTPQALVYSYRVSDDAKTPLGVLCLCFRFENEMERIFAQLSTSKDWSVIVLLDASGKVIASSDRYHIPIGAPLEKIGDRNYCVERFAGREYLSTTRATNGYQGYRGPGWYGRVLLPVQHAFENDASALLHDIDREALRSVLENSSLFGDKLRSIPVQANRIQRDLNRSVWNGNVRQTSQREAVSPVFSKILLWEISRTGNRTKDVFAHSIADLHQTVVSSILQDSLFFATLAIDIMDRNLYERANDCRWWARTSLFRELLAGGDLPAAAGEQIAAILKTINSLYTVYSDILVFDRQGRILARSQDGPRDLRGEQLQDEWVRQVLTLPDSQSYAVSAFSPSPLYAGQATYIFGAAIRSPDEQTVVGGVAIVFDSTPQFAAMLHDALPKDEAGQLIPGAFGAFVDDAGCVIASTHAAYPPGAMLPVAASGRRHGRGEGHATIALVDGTYYALGARVSAGYREYRNDANGGRKDVSALIFIPLCQNDGQRQSVAPKRAVVRSDQAKDGDTIEIATFRIGSKWFGLRSKQIVESVNFAGTTAVPGAGRDLAGYLMYREAPIPVFDIRRSVDAEPSAGHGDDAEPQIVILRKAENAHFGILVNDLGDIPEVLVSRLQPLPDMTAGGNILADAIVMTDQPETETLLVVLSTQRIVRRFIDASLPLDERDARGRLAASAS